VEHLTDAQLESIVAGTFTDDAAREHVAGCRSCSARLAREARVELVLQEIAHVAGDGTGVRAAVLRDALRSRRAWRIGVSAAAGLVVVALGMALLSRGPMSVQTPASKADAVTADALESIDTPGLQDPRILGPGATAFPPTSLCRWVTAPSSPTMGM